MIDQRRGAANRRRWASAVRRPLTAVGVVAIAALVARAVLAAPRRAEGLGPEVSEHLARAGASNPVTAVLLNFRGYDTVLEIVVLLAALLALPATARRVRSPRHSGPILELFVRVLTPLAVIVGAYLLWAGSKAPGGAFPAGAVLAAAGVLLALSRAPAERAVGSRGGRWAAVGGLAVFLLVVVGPLAFGGALLEYPADWASGLILLVEAASTVSIAGILAMLFAGRSPLARSAATPVQEETP